MPERLSPEGYTAAGGSICPACEGTDLGQVGLPTLTREVVTRRLVCENCGATWTAVYTLTGYEGLTTREHPNA